jgi:hypothetical protein
MNNLKNYVNWKLTHADKTAEAEGYPLVLENCKANKRMKQLEIYGNSVQDGTPTPDNPIEVESVGVKSVNLFDVSTYPLTVGCCIWGTTGEASNPSYPMYACTLDYVPCTDLQGKTITINHTSGNSVGMGFYDENKTFISGIGYKNATSKTITVPDTAFYYRFSVDANYIDEIQVQLGSTATPYEPYGKYKIPLLIKGDNEIITHKIFLDEPLRKIGDYADYVDFKENKVVRNTSEKVFDGSEDWIFGTTKEITQVFYYVINLYNPAHFISNRFVSGLDGDVEKIILLGDKVYLAIKKTTASDVDTFKTWLSENNVDVIYSLAEPTEESINLDLPKLTAKTTIIEVDTSLAPSNAYGKYIKR